MAVFIIFAIFFISIDRFLKILALIREVNFEIIGSLLKFNFAPNINIAFSLPLSGVFLEGFIAVIIIVLLFWFVRLLKEGKVNQAGLIFMISLGAASNLFDRFKYGFVIDYFDLKYFTVFNLADMMIVGSTLALLYFLYKEEEKNTKKISSEN